MRPDWPQYFTDMLAQVGTRSTCMRRRVSCIVTTTDHRILATGYNGAPSGVPHCDGVGCLRAEMNIPSGERHEICRAVHAEQNAIAQAAKNGINLSHSIAYVSTVPCVICSKIMINSGIAKIYMANFEYPDKLGIGMLLDAGVLLFAMKDGEFYPVRKCLKCHKPMLLTNPYGFMCCGE